MRYEIVFSAGDSHLMCGSLAGRMLFQIRDIELNRCTGMIVKEYVNCEYDFCSNGTLYIVEFPRSANPMEKLMILSAVQGID